MTIGVGAIWSGLKGLVFGFGQLMLAINFVTTGLIVDFIQFLLFILIKPWSPHLYREINYYVTYTLNSQVVFLVDWWSGSTVTMYADPAEAKKYFGKEHAWILLNHCYEVDWVVGWVICDRVSILGNAKVYVKKVLQYMPVLGWSWKFQEDIFLERNWEKDKTSLGTQLGRLVEYKSPWWLSMYAEGTRFTKAKHEASMEVARQKGLPELKHHLLPRTRGFVGSLPFLKKGKVPAIYDFTVAFRKDSKYEPTVSTMVKGKPLEAFILIRRVPMDEVPDDPVEAADWLQKFFQHKDKVMDNFIQRGDFNPDKNLKEYKNFEYINQGRRKYALINTCAWGSAILLTMGYYFFGMIASGSYISAAVTLALVLAAYIGMAKLINLTKIDHASGYGVVTINGKKLE